MKTKKVIVFNDKDLELITSPQKLSSLKGGCIDPNIGRKRDDFEDILKDILNLNSFCSDPFIVH